MELGPAYDALTDATDIWILAVWAARRGSAGLAGQFSTILAARAGATGLRKDSVLSESATAHAALAAGDTSGALARLVTLVSRPAPVEDLNWDIGAPLGFDRLVLGRLLIQRQEYAKAIGVLDVLDSPMPAVFPLYRRASLTARIEAADALNRAALGDSLRARLATLSDK